MRSTRRQIVSPFLLILFLLPGRYALADDTAHRVVFLHYDYMVQTGPDAHSHEPDPRSIRLVVDAFRRNGVTLQIDPQHNEIPEKRVVTLVADSDRPDANMDPRFGRLGIHSRVHKLTVLLLRERAGWGGELSSRTLGWN